MGLVIGGTDEISFIFPGLVIRGNNKKHCLAGFNIRGTDENSFIVASLLVRGTDDFIKIFLRVWV